MPKRPEYHREDRPRPRIKRPSPTRRGYGRSWQRLRLVVLARRPWCACGALATEVDHVDNDRRNVSFDNLMSMCKNCHSRKTVLHDGGLGRGPRISGG